MIRLVNKFFSLAYLNFIFLFSDFSFANNSVNDILDDIDVSLTLGVERVEIETSKTDFKFWTPRISLDTN